MAIGYPKPPSKVRTPLIVTDGTGPTLAQQINSATAQGPAITPTSTSTLQLLGVDIVPFAFVGNPPDAVTFPNLPYRTNENNPLAANTGATQTLRIQPKDHLIFVVFVQGLSAPAGTVVGVSPQALDTNDLVLPGPFLGSNSFKTFQAVFSIAASKSGRISGAVVGMLLLSVG